MSIKTVEVPGIIEAVAVPDGFREIVEAVAHIGVDFGYGNFDLSQEHIEKARALLEATPQPEEQKPAPDELSDYDRGFRDGKLDRLIDEVVAESELVEALEELADLMEDTRRGEYIPDSFTTQPARIALATYRNQGGGVTTNKPEVKEEEDE